MCKILSLLLVLMLAFGSSTALAMSDSASYYGGTMAEFKEAKKEVKGHLITSDEKALVFKYGSNQTASTPYAHFIDREYAQKPARRVGAAVATTVLLGPI